VELVVLGGAEHGGRDDDRGDVERSAEQAQGEQAASSASSEGIIAMTLTKIAFAAGLFALAAPTISFASQTSPYERCRLPGHTCMVHGNLVGAETTVYGELESHGRNTAIPPSFTPDGRQPSTKIIVEDPAGPVEIGHGSQDR